VPRRPNVAVAAPSTDGGLWFFLPAADERLAALDPDADWRELQVGEQAWILQTFLRLSVAGLPVGLTAWPGPGIVVYHSKHWRQLELRRSHRDTVMVAVRGDLRPAPNADFEIVQNPRSADARRRFYLPHWPQPGLVPRDPGRGDRLRRVGYHGLLRHLHPSLSDPAWAESLARLGVEWDADAVAEAGRQGGSSRWTDYRDLDAVVALRPASRRLYPTKPPTKLFNAWLAGVPVIVGPESACRAVRRDPLDFVEVADPDEALAAVARLARDPRLYRAMVEQGSRRAAEVTTEALVGLWCELLLRTIPRRAHEVAGSLPRRLPRPARLALGRLRRHLTVR
jgi:hypothetical protein